MVFLVPKAYNKIKDEGIAVGVERGRAEGRAEGERAERERNLAAMREAMRNAGVDEETRRRVEDDVARRNGY